jgi:hypothetical protein
MNQPRPDGGLCVHMTLPKSRDDGRSRLAVSGFPFEAESSQGPYGFRLPRPFAPCTLICGNDAVALLSVAGDVPLGPGWRQRARTNNFRRSKTQHPRAVV